MGRMLLILPEFIGPRVAGNMGSYTITRAKKQGLRKHENTYILDK